MSNAHIEELRAKSEIGKLAQDKEKARLRRESARKKRLEDLAEAQARISKAEGPSGTISRATARGEYSIDICLLRSWYHYKSDISAKNPLKSLGLIGRTIYRHFSSQGFKVFFVPWDDGQSENFGYELWISWKK
jgi:hypothetical protein